MKQKREIMTKLWITREFETTQSYEVNRDVRTLADNLKEMGYTVAYQMPMVTNAQIEVLNINNSTEIDEIRMEVEEYFPEFNITEETL
tara:strand:+ start:427 stop:690 length:264 start_codon:yes stop_codon:yes gene_type:complete